MVDPLLPARELAERVRYPGDNLRSVFSDRVELTQAVASLLFRQELEISAEVTPGLWGQLELVRNRLMIPAGSVHAFVYGSPELQAHCFTSSRSACVIRFSSALIDLLDEEEFAFVCGHELGHFLLGHGLARNEANLSIEFFMQQRAQEISVDRVGLIACESLDVSIRALIKTVSGLNSRHLRFDVARFVSQLTKSGALDAYQSLDATHPSVLVRCRALLWFSLNSFVTDGPERFSPEQFEELDQRVEKDLERYVDGPARKQIEEAKADLALWTAALRIVESGSFERSEQRVFAEMFGVELLERLKIFLKDIPKADAQDVVFERVRLTRESLEVLIPSTFEAEVRQIQERISANFR